MYILKDRAKIFISFPLSPAQALKKHKLGVQPELQGRETLKVLLQHKHKSWQGNIWLKPTLIYVYNKYNIGVNV